MRRAIAQRAPKEPAAFPVEVGDVVGWDSKRVKVIDRDIRYQKVRIQWVEGFDGRDLTIGRAWVPITELSDPPEQAEGGDS